MKKHMDAVTKNRWRKFFATSRTNKVVALVIGVAVIAAGGYFLTRSFAAGFLASLDINKGTVSGPAFLVNEGNTQVVQFGSSQPTTPPPTTGGYPGVYNTGIPQGLPGDTRQKVVDNPDGTKLVWTLLKPYTGPRTITQDGTVIDGVYINILADDDDPNTTADNKIVIKAKNVVIKNSYIRVSNIGGNNNKEAIATYDDAANLLIVDSEITGLSETFRPTDESGGGQPLVSRTGYTLLRANLHGYGDIIRADGNAVIQDSWLHNPVNAAGVDPHNDVIQSTNATRIRIIHNRLEHTPGATQTSCILLKADIGPISDVIVDNNLINGGGYSVYWYDSGYKSTNGKFTNNRWMRSPTGGMWPKGGYWGPWASNAASAPVWSGNVWDDTGTPINL